MNKRYGEAAVAGAIFLMGMILLAAAYQIDVGAAMGKGGDFMPKLCTALLTLFGGVLFAHELAKARRAAPSGDGGKEAGGKDDMALFAQNCLLLVVYVALIWPVGFLLSTAFYIAAQMYLFSPRRKIHVASSILVGAATSPIIYYAFVSGFQLLLPEGIFG